MSFERTFCAAEIEQLKELLQEIPDENVIERIGLEQRLIQAKDRLKKFLEADDVKHSANRLKDDNIREEQETFIGTLLGILPDSMTFEFKITESSEIIKGKLNSEIEKAESLYQQWQGKEVQAIFRTRQVGDSAPRYILKSIDNLRDDLAK